MDYQGPTSNPDSLGPGRAALQFSRDPACSYLRLGRRASNGVMRDLYYFHSTHRRPQASGPSCVNGSLLIEFWCATDARHRLCSVDVGISANIVRQMLINGDTATCAFTVHAAASPNPFYHLATAHGCNYMPSTWSDGSFELNKIVLARLPGQPSQPSLHFTS